MRVLYIDIDSLRPDHLGCYGYHRDTSPNIDRLAAEGVRLDNCYASDAPCLPSRTALITGRFGIHNGVVSHGGTAADPFIDGPDRWFQSRVGTESWTRVMRQADVRSATITAFAERHSALQWYSGFNEFYNLGKMGIETADEVSAVALDWLKRNGAGENWYLHVNLWDPHTPYRTPLEYGNPFEDEPLPEWYTEAVREEHWTRPGPHSAQDMVGYGGEPRWGEQFPRQPFSARSMDDVRRMFDGYDTGTRYADDHIGRILNELADQGLLDETAIVVTADHGENLGELGIYCDHHTADHLTARIPMIIRWPDVPGGRVDRALHYHVDVAATVLELLGVQVPRGWDGRSFAKRLREGSEEGREFLVTSQAAWCVQRGVRFENWICLRTYHDAYHGFPDTMLFDLDADPHEQRDLASERPDIVAEAMRLLEDWRTDAMATSTHAVDPLWTTLQEGGGWHARGRLPEYLERLRSTGRGEWADRLATRYGPAGE